MKTPELVAVAGPNGAGKTTFYHAHLSRAGLRFVNADVLAADLRLGPAAAARVADAVRLALLERGESFTFETVFSDPVGDKLSFLKRAVAKGYGVTVCFIGLATPEIADERVAMRVSQGGHDVPAGTIRSRFPRVLANLKRAIRELPDVRVYDNSDLRRPFRAVARFQRGRRVNGSAAVPKWLDPLV